MKNKKGFTIVELVIVIAVIAILAAVLIPTFSGVIGKANVSARTQEFTNALKVVLAGNAETGALADGTIFVQSDFYAYYNGNKLGDITATTVDGTSTIKLLEAANITENATQIQVSFKKDKSATATEFQIKSVILPFRDGSPLPEAVTAVGTFFGGTAAYANSKVTITTSENKVLTLNCYSNLDLTSGMFVLSPTN